MIADLQQLYKSGRLIPFVGAGVSMSVQWAENETIKSGVSWDELVVKAADILGFSDVALLRARGTDLQILEYFRLIKGGMAPLTNWMYAEMRPPDEALRSSRVHSALAKLEHCPVYYTTNYDDFLERSLQLEGRRVRVVANEAMLSERNPGTEVIKFHGDFSHPDEMVLSESQYEERLSLISVMDLRFQADMLGRALLFLGYSFRDANVAYIFHLAQRRLNRLPGTPDGRRAYIAVPEPSKFELQLFRARNIEVIPLDSTRLADATADLLESIRG